MGREVGVGRVHRASQLDELPPDGPREPSNADRFVGVPVRDPGQRGLQEGADGCLSLGRRAGEDGSGRREDDLQADVLVKTGLERLEGGITSHDGSLDVATLEGDRGQRGVGLRAPRCVTREERQELLDLRRRPLDELHQLAVRCATRAGCRAVGRCRGR